MGKRTSHPPGTFSWVDLATTDPAAAKAFYTELFGWETEDNDAGEGAVYTMCRVDGDDVSGLYELGQDQRDAGVPPNWTSYVTVAEADAAVARAPELGGGALGPAFDVMEIGRMAMLTDPQGAVFAVWQPGERIGAERVNDVGCLTMNELSTTDLDAAGAFYEGLFGWTTAPIDTGPEGPAMLAASNDGRLNASLTAQADVPPHWRPYFTVESTEATLERAQGLGGTLVFGPQVTPGGTFAILTDPQGAVFGVFQGEVDP